RRRRRNTVRIAEMSKDADRSFRLTTGFVAVCVIILVAGIGFVLVRESLLSINKFGLAFWRTDIWDSVAGEFGARPFIWGTLYSSFLALPLSTPVALGIAIFLSELSPASWRTPLTFLTELLAAIPSIVYGVWGLYVLVPFVRMLQVHMPDFLRKLPFFTG